MTNERAILRVGQTVQTTVPSRSFPGLMETCTFLVTEVDNTGRATGLRLLETSVVAMPAERERWIDHVRSKLKAGEDVNAEELEP